MTLDPDAPLCTSGKRPFRTQEQAEGILRHVRHRRAVEHAGRLHDVECAVYECPVCHWWHLTSGGRPQRRSRLGNRGRRQR